MRFGRHLVDLHGKLLVGHGVVLIERRYHRRDSALRVDHDHRTAAHTAVVTRGSAERDEPLVSGIATEQALVAEILRPGMKIVGRIVRNANQNYLLSIVEQARVLVTVRRKLDCSTTRPCAEEER